MRDEAAAARPSRRRSGPRPARGRTRRRRGPGSPRASRPDRAGAASCPARAAAVGQEARARGGEERRAARCPPRSTRLRYSSTTKPVARQPDGGRDDRARAGACPSRCCASTRPATAAGHAGGEVAGEAPVGRLPLRVEVHVARRARPGPSRGSRGCCTVPSLRRITMKPPPPRLPASGCTTARANPTATAASTALPPWRRMSRPTALAMRLPDTTIAREPLGRPWRGRRSSSRTRCRRRGAGARTSRMAASGEPAATATRRWSGTRTKILGVGECRRSCPGRDAV